ncbi:hypothetical protein BDW74DRAFT_180322 [Aspergillus multicolor]|uniref:uncharacterized protein n=1 Tax=Aspergillus multicolor TaxID=41759 RepID=UPI003CCCD83A
MTRSLDENLQKAARNLLNMWWLIPNLNINSTETYSLFWETRRLAAQMTYYNLLNQLHMPFMLSSSSSGHKYEYSRITCVNASRENMEKVNRLNGDALSAKSADLLRRLLKIDAQKANSDQKVSVQEPNMRRHCMMMWTAQRSSKEVRKSPPATTMPPPSQSNLVDTPQTPYPPTYQQATLANPPSVARPPAGSATGPIIPIIFGYTPAKVEALSASVSVPAQDNIPPNMFLQPQTDFDDPSYFQQQSGYPGLTANAGDWAFQGVDMAFFESLMRSNEQYDGVDWTSYA